MWQVAVFQNKHPDYFSLFWLFLKVSLLQNFTPILLSSNYHYNGKY